MPDQPHLTARQAAHVERLLAAGERDVAEAMVRAIAWTRKEWTDE
jgi:hypothetical protein